MYRFTWLCFVALAGTAGVWAVVHAVSLFGAMTLLLVVGIGVLCVALSATPEGQPTQWRRAIRLGAGCGVGTVAAVGLLFLLRLSGLVVVTALVIFSPTALRAARTRYSLTRHHTVRAREGRDSRRRGEAVRRTEPAELDRQPPVADSLLAAWMETPVEALDDPALCFAWRRSYVALQRPLAAHARLRIVERRREFLDELERRNAAGFAAWLCSGARAAGDPSKYICRLERRPHGGDE